jgi:hypothetical protein
MSRIVGLNRVVVAHDVEHIVHKKTGEPHRVVIVTYLGDQVQRSVFTPREALSFATKIIGEAMNCVN